MFLRGRTEGPESRGERPGMELLILRMKIQGLDNEGTGKAFFFFFFKNTGAESLLNRKEHYDSQGLLRQ